jgi:hypothetical protein
MSWTKANMFVGSHLWFIRQGTAFTSPGVGTVDNANIPDNNEPLWDNYYLGIVESMSIDPKFAGAEEILAPNPGHLVKLDTVIPYQTPIFGFTLKNLVKEAIEMAFNAADIIDATVSFNPTAGTSGIRGYVKCQNYDHADHLLLDWQAWVFLKLKSPLKFDGKTMTKPEFEAELLYSVNNVGSI